MCISDMQTITLVIMKRSRVTIGNDEKSQLESVTRWPYSIRNIENPSEAVLLAAVNGDSKFFWTDYMPQMEDSVANLPLSVKLAIVRAQPESLGDFQDAGAASFALIMAAVTANPYLVSSIMQLPTSVMLAAVRQNGLAIQNIIDHSEHYGGRIPTEVMITAVQQNSRALRILYDNNIDVPHSVVHAALTEDRNAIRFVPDPEKPHLRQI